MASLARLAPWLLAGGLVACSQSSRVDSGPGPATAAAAATLAAPPSAPSSSAAQVDPENVLRIAPAEARRRVQTGGALLVCAYEDDAKYQNLKLDGSMSLHELEKKLPSLTRDQEIIFYCA